MPVRGPVRKLLEHPDARWGPGWDRPWRDRGDRVRFPGADVSLLKEGGA